jgi:hypothetical protein
MNTSVADPLHNTNTEIAAAQYEDGLIGLSEELAKYTQDVTKNAAYYERAYQDTLSGSAVRTSRPAKHRSPTVSQRAGSAGLLASLLSAVNAGYARSFFTISTERLRTD